MTYLLDTNVCIAAMRGNPMVSTETELLRRPSKADMRQHPENR